MNKDTRFLILMWELYMVILLLLNAKTLSSPVLRQKALLLVIWYSVLGAILTSIALAILTVLQ